MNDEDFENKLRAITRALHRPDPTPAWKADILARARREAEATRKTRLLPPRWLMAGWAAAWVAILAMKVVTQQAPDIAVKPTAAQAQTGSEPWPPQGGLPTLVAFHQQLNLNLDNP